MKIYSTTCIDNGQPIPVCGTLSSWIQCLALDVVILFADCVITQLRLSGQPVYCLCHVWLRDRLADKYRGVALLC